MAYIGATSLHTPVNTFHKEDFTGADTGTNNSIANSIILTQEVTGLSASNIELFLFHDDGADRLKNFFSIEPHPNATSKHTGLTTLNRP